MREEKTQTTIDKILISRKYGFITQQIIHSVLCDLWTENMSESYGSRTNIITVIESFVVHLELY